MVNTAVEDKKNPNNLVMNEEIERILDNSTQNKFMEKINRESQLEKTRFLFNQEK